MTITNKQRIDSLKSLSKLANHYLSYYKTLKNQKTEKWIDNKAENSIQQLKEIITQINKDLHPKKVELYCKPMPTFEKLSVADILSDGKSDERNIINEYLGELLEQTNWNFAVFDIIRFAPEQNIIHDITWLTDGTLKNYIEIGLGEKTVEFFECYLSSNIQEVEENLIPYFKKENGFSEKIKIIEHAIKHSKNENFLISNILLITVTESIVRELCKFIYQEQNINYSPEKVDEYVNRKFTSLDKLISNGNWKNDYPIGLVEAISTYRDVSEENINNWRVKYQKHKKANRKIKQLTYNFSEVLKTVDTTNEELLRNKFLDNLKSLEDLMPDLLSDDEKEIKINLATMLNFLIRKYKDDRNLIIHGNFETFNHKWKNYISYAAILKVFDTYKNYHDLYAKQNGRQQEYCQ